MHGSTSSLATSVSSWLLVLLCAVSGAYCLRQVRGSGGAAGEAVMGFGMALMALPLGDGDGWRIPVLAVVFCGASLHALWLLRGGAHHAHHLVGSLTMVYMTLTAATGAGGGQGHGPGHAAGAGPPLLTGALLLYFAGYVVLGGTRLITAGGGAAAPSDAGRGGPTELIRACRLAMGMGMLAMLLAM
ncbi:DUF5134 domain-containing protein [Streptomyces avidinii]|uniref:DUF5134 domain-containing protein n=1 Tax=Streptomyces avidinii TaxID=1895 RepID=A0ABS4L459_STRAV|nr:DUF5134 domain-containing protein [Streptomyces avidinii]MBP2036891.1 hypothetical protein [Streptomyces avidinii]GGY93692.1 DUF5134 domain-containing protein [Streptomyces avidinii]